MKKILKITAALLALLMLASIFAACAKDGDSGDGEAGDGASTNSDDALDTLHFDNLPELDYDGAVITIATRDRDNFKRDFTAELNGEVLGDAIYKRNMAVQERLNVAFQYAVLSTAESSGAPDQIIRNEVLSGNDTFDIAQVRTYDAVEMVLDGTLEDGKTLFALQKVFLMKQREQKG